MAAPILVFGHKNPDNDAISAAVGYAYLKNELAKRAGSDAVYEACRLGGLPPETEWILGENGIEAPRLIESLSEGQQVILVDHNEALQSADGLDAAEIVEIIDHHRLADIQTGGPIYFRNEPVGSTATIISEMYQERGLMPPAKLAGLIAAAIVADTVMFKSPTSTAVDRRMADRMARIANISLDELGKTIFSASISDDKPADALLFTDFKDFHIADHDFGVSQITCVDSERMMQRKDEFLAVMQKTMGERGYTLMILMLTDVLLEGTHLLYLGDEDIITQAFGVQLKDHTCFLPGVVSRKKQVIPMLTALWG